MKRLIAFALVLLSGCVSPSIDKVRVASPAAGPEQAIPVGSNSVGEACRAEAAPNDNDALDAKRIFDIKCGTWTRPSGRIIEVASSGGDRATLRAVAETGAWHSDLGERLTCAAPQDTSITGNLPAVWMRCARRNGGLPHVAFAAAAGANLYLADGLPPAQQALESAVLRLSGAAPIPAAQTQSTSSAADLLRAEIANASFGNKEEEDYDHLMRLGRGFNQESRYAQAEYYYRQALALSQKLLGQNNSASAQPMMHLAVVLSNEQRFTDADALFKRTGELLTGSTDHAINGLFLYYRSIHAANQRQRDDAIRLAQQSQDEFEKSGSGQQVLQTPGGTDDLLASLVAEDNKSRSVQQVNLHVGQVQTTALRAEIERRQEKYDDSQALVDKVRPVALASRITAPDSTAAILELSGRNLVSLGKVDRGEQDLLSAIEQLDKQFANTLPHARAYFLIGAFYHQQKRDDAALGAFRKGAAVLRDQNLTLPIALVLPYLDTLYATSMTNASERAVLQAEMFEAAQLAASSNSAQFIADAAAQLAEGDDKAAASIRNQRELREEVERTASKLDAENAKPREAQDPQAVAALQASLKEDRKKLDDAEEQVQVLAPSFNLVRAKTVTAQGTAALLRSGEALYAIAVGETGSYGFLLKNGAVTAFPVPLGAADAQAAVDGLRKAVIVRGTANGVEWDPYDVAAAYALYQKLFGPVKDQLADVRQLIVAQSGPLLSLPFAMLVASEPGAIENNDYTKVDWLIRHVSLSYVTSMQSFAILRQGTPHHAEKPFIGFGDYIPPPDQILAEAAPGNDCADDREALQTELGRLPSARQEVEAAADIMGAGHDVRITGENFTKAAILGSDIGQYRVIHFATHALLPSDLKCRGAPTLLVSLPASDRNGADIFFDSNDIVKLKLNADLVVLSACNSSSQGGKSSGDSLSGLAQSFFVSGARGLLVSHWLAADQTTAYMMAKMYSGMASGGGLSTADALRQAQLEFISSSGGSMAAYSHPLFWALFTVIGEGVQPHPRV